MTDYKKLLELIEANPTRDDDLDEIDAQFWCYQNKKDFKESFYIENTLGICSSIPEICCGNIQINVTRCRTLLKAVRDEHLPGWCAGAQAFYGTYKRPEGVQWEGYCTKPDFSKYHPHNPSRWIKCFTNDLKLDTEELAELHVIIQAIEWKRNNE